MNIKINLGLATRRYETLFRTDFAIVELDQPVVGRTPESLSKKEVLETGDKVFYISYRLECRPK